MSKRAVALSTMLATAAALTCPAIASATYPGQNGKLIYAVAKNDKRGKDGFSLGTTALQTVLIDGTGASALPHKAKFNDYEPAWSPDGAQIAYVSSAGGKRDGIYAADANNTSPRLVSKSKSADAPTWTPDGRFITYLDYAKGILTVPADGSTRPRLLAKHPKGWLLMGPTYTPNGSTIVFAKMKVSGAPEKSRSELWAMDASGANPRRIVSQDDNLIFPNAPDVSPDGTTIAFEGMTSEGLQSIWTAALNGTNTRVFADGSSDEILSAPTWSPDGTKIAASLLTFSVKKGSALVTFDASSGAMTTVRRASKAYLMSPSWQSIPAPVAAPASR